MRLTKQDIEFIGERRIDKIKSQMSDVYWSICYLRGYVSPDKADLANVVEHMKELGETIDRYPEIKEIEQSFIDTYYPGGLIHYGGMGHPFHSIGNYLDVAMGEFIEWTKEDVNERINEVKQRVEYAKKGGNPYTFVADHERDQFLEMDIKKLHPDKFQFSRGSRPYRTLQDLKEAFSGSEKNTENMTGLKEILNTAYNELNEAYKELVSSTG